MKLEPDSPVTSPAAAPPHGWVLFDGDCGICARLAAGWERTLRRAGYAVAPLQAEWVRARLGADLEDLLRDILLFQPPATIYRGADAYLRVMRGIWWLAPLGMLLRLPGLYQLTKFSYRQFAANRHRISRSCGLKPAPSQPPHGKRSG